VPPPDGTEAPREYKVPIPRLSGKEKASDIPRPFEGKRPYVGESGTQGAERVFDETYGKGNWSLKNSKTRQDFNKLKKYFDRGFRDPKPKALPVPETDAFGKDYVV
jgi:hypothetical protein